MLGERKGTITVINNNQLNNSPAKLQYSFSKDSRFNMRNGYCREAFYRGSAQEFNTINAKKNEKHRLRNVQSFSSFTTATRWR